MPLSYDAQKCILQYMDPNLRFQFSRRCPSIRVVEKLVPLRIDHLTFGNMRTEINGTRYQLGVYRNYPPEVPIPDQHSNENAEGGSKKDFDQFDMEDPSASITVTPGDVDLWMRNRLPRAENREFLYQQMELALRTEEDALRGLVRHGFNDPIRLNWMEGHIARLRQRLQPYYRKRDNEAPSFQHLLQLTITSNERATYERFQYNRKLHEALKYLNAVFFGGRSMEIRVKKLSLLNTFSIYRFPLGLQLRVETIHSVLVEYSRLDHMITNPYSTIDLVVARTFQTADIFDQPAVNQARSLTIYVEQVLVHRPVFESLRAVQTQRVFISNQIMMNDYTQLVNIWLENGRPIGTMYTFGIQEEETGKECMKRMKIENATRVLFDRKRFITFSMPSGTSKLLVYCERVLPQPEPENGITPWNLILRVEQI